MNADNLLIIGALGAAVYYVMHQSTAAAAASGTPAPSPAPVAPMVPTINVQPSTIPLSNPIASLAPAPMPLAPSPGPAPAPPIPVIAIPPPATGMTYTIPDVAPSVPYPSTPAPAPPPPIPTFLSVPVSSGPMPITYTDPIPTIGPTPPPPTVQPGIVPTAPASVASIAVAPPVPTYYPVFNSFFSRPGSTLYPGDTWTATISGAKPGAKVEMMLSQSGGNSVNNVMGYADPGGSFSYTGRVNTGTDGQWSQLWFVNGGMIGSLGFTVFDPVVNAAMPVTTYNSNIPNTPIGTPQNPTQGPLIIGGTVYQTGTLWI